MQIARLVVQIHGVPRVVPDHATGPAVHVTVQGVVRPVPCVESTRAVGGDGVSVGEAVLVAGFVLDGEVVHVRGAVGVVVELDPLVVVGAVAILVDGADTDVDVTRVGPFGVLVPGVVVEVGGVT